MDRFPRRMDGESVRMDRKRTDTGWKRIGLDAEDTDTDLKSGLTVEKRLVRIGK